MVTRNENGFTIAVPTVAGHPAEEYTETIDGLIDVLQSRDPEMHLNDFYVLELLRAMLPTFEQAKAMMDLDYDDGKIKQIHEKYVLKCCK